jgi:hypothetical protein
LDLNEFTPIWYLYIYIEIFLMFLNHHSERVPKNKLVWFSCILSIFILIEITPHILDITIILKVQCNSPMLYVLQERSNLSLNLIPLETLFLSHRPIITLLPFKRSCLTIFILVFTYLSKIPPCQKVWFENFQSCVHLYI